MTTEEPQDAIPGVARYQPREPLFLEAICFTGDNGPDVEAFSSGTFEAPPFGASDGKVWNRHQHEIQRVPPGWWVVRGVTGDFFARSAEDFAATYEAAGGPAGAAPLPPEIALLYRAATVLQGQGTEDDHERAAVLVAAAERRTNLDPALAVAREVLGEGAHAQAQERTDLLPAGARAAAEAAYRNWRIGDDGEGRLHAALVAYAAAAQAGADHGLRDRMAAMEETIRAGERERIAGLMDGLAAASGGPSRFAYRNAARMIREQAGRG